VATLPPTGQVIVYTYTITNTGTDFICAPIQIADNKAGNKQVCGPDIAPGASITTTLSYTVTAADTAARSVTNGASAYVQIDKCKWLASCPACLTINSAP
jgi:hypothetical protein